MPEAASPSPPEPRWKFIERTVAVLEHMLAPGALVQHNQQIKELVSGIPRQCDVVVWYGAPPRQTLAAIAEVQDRGSKVGLQTFEAWCAKRVKLGAQRLICVSCEGFTEEVQKAAASMGDIVSLMTLCEADQRPPFLATTVVMSHMQVLHYRDAKVVYLDKLPPISGTLKERLYEFSDVVGKSVALYDLAEVALKKGLAKDVERCQVDANFYDLKYRVEFWRSGTPLVLKHEDQIYKVWEVYFVDRTEEVRQGLSSTPLAYQQESVNGALAWVLLSKGVYQGKEFYSQQSFRTSPNGAIQVGPHTMSKIEGMHSLSHAVEMWVPVEPQQAKSQ
jgi:hypothetical protein